MVFVRQKLIVIGALALIAPTIARAEPEPSLDKSDAELGTRVERQKLVRVALERSPLLAASRHKVRALRADGEAEGSLPPPELMFEIWQVPFATPLSFGDAQMIQLGIKQEIPPPGSLSRKREAFEQKARVEGAQALGTERLITREVSHAFADYAEAVARHAAHTEHRSVAERMQSLAQARQAGGGSLADLAAAEVELARADVELAADESRIDGARARLNGLLGRAPDAPLGPPVDEGAMTLAESTSSLSNRASAQRPELSAARAERAANLAESEAAGREATWPAFTVGALYFPPTNVMPEHSYGVSLSARLPWLWGGARDRREAARERALASSEELENARRVIAVELASSTGQVRSETARHRALAQRVLPAAERARDTAFAGYESGRAQISAVLTAEQGVIDTRTQLAASKASLDHALIELDFISGAPVRRAPAISNKSEKIP